MAKPTGGLPKGVRGPTGSSRAAVERRSMPLLVTLNRLPRWIVVVLMGSLLFIGLIQTGDLAWLGGICLAIVALFLGWLLALAWPVLPVQARLIRGIVVAAAAGISVLKFTGNF